MTRQHPAKELTPEYKALLDTCDKYRRNLFNAACKASGIQAGIDYLTGLQGTTAPLQTSEEVTTAVLSPLQTSEEVTTAVLSPLPILEEVTTAVLSPLPPTNHKTAVTTKKLTALIPGELHTRVMLHATIQGTSVNRIIAQLIADHVPDYEVTVRG